MRYFTISKSDIQYNYSNLNGEKGMEIDYGKIGERIRGFRMKEKMTQAELAERSEVEPSNISHIERGATKVSLPTLVKIANALQVSLDEIVCDSLKKSGHVSVKEIDGLLRDCSDAELKAFVSILKTTKEILRRG